MDGFWHNFKPRCIFFAKTLMCRCNLVLSEFQPCELLVYFTHIVLCWHLLWMTALRGFCLLGFDLGRCRIFAFPEFGSLLFCISEFFAVFVVYFTRWIRWA
ncbi:hypothetical protein BJ165DRAFT_1512182 [Panaeolus papilionaceus]|nr:hypothetical protein BJ165DRAFT_1512182 [Panaeolus papilionaceus]